MQCTLHRQACTMWAQGQSELMHAHLQHRRRQLQCMSFSTPGMPSPTNKHQPLHVHYQGRVGLMRVRRIGMCLVSRSPHGDHSCSCLGAHGATSPWSQHYWLCQGCAVSHSASGLDLLQGQCHKEVPCMGGIPLCQWGTCKVVAAPSISKVHTGCR